MLSVSLIITWNNNKNYTLALQHQLQLVKIGLKKIMKMDKYRWFGYAIQINKDDFVKCVRELQGRVSQGDHK